MRDDGATQPNDSEPNASGTVISSGTSYSLQ